MLFALGLGERVVAVTHECDYPPGVEQLPHLTRSVIPEGLEAAGIDAAVRERTSRGEALYELDAETLEELDVDLIVLGARGLAGVRAFLGSVSNHVVQHAHRPVLVVPAKAS